MALQLIPREGLVVLQKGIKVAWLWRGVVCEPYLAWHCGGGKFFIAHARFLFRWWPIIFFFWQRERLRVGFCVCRPRRHALFLFVRVISFMPKCRGRAAAPPHGQGIFHHPKNATGDPIYAKASCTAVANGVLHRGQSMSPKYKGASHGRPAAAGRRQQQQFP